jgi:hypothetical protein
VSGISSVVDVVSDRLNDIACPFCPTIKASNVVVNESYSREGENNCEHSSGDNNAQGEIVITISSPQVDVAIRTVDAANDNERDNVEDDDVVVDNERSDVGGDELVVVVDEVVVVGTIPCPTNPNCEISDKKEKTSEKQLIVYQRRRVKTKGKKVELPQPQHADPSVTVLSSDASPPTPSNSSTSTETRGDVSSSFDHVELSLTQCRAPRVNAENLLLVLVLRMILLILLHTLVSHLHVELLLHHYRQCLYQRVGGVLSMI